MSNPLLNESKYLDNSNAYLSRSERMTVEGAVNKSFVLFGLLLTTSVMGFLLPNPVFLFGGLIVGLIAVIVAAFKPNLSHVLAPVYALAEGFVVGTVTYFYAFQSGASIIFQAISLTIAALFMMLFLYKTGIIKVTAGLRTGIMIATGAIALTYLINMIMSFFGTSMPFIHQGGTYGIIFSLVVVGIASMNLLLDFDMFERGAASGAPKYMEWYSAMGLLVTLVWLYLEILRLLSKLRD